MGKKEEKVPGAVRSSSPNPVSLSHTSVKLFVRVRTAGANPMREC